MIILAILAILATLVAVIKQLPAIVLVLVLDGLELPAALLTWLPFLACWLVGLLACWLVGYRNATTRAAANLFLRGRRIDRRSHPCSGRLACRLPLASTTLLLLCWLLLLLVPLMLLSSLWLLLCGNHGRADKGPLRGRTAVRGGTTGRSTASWWEGVLGLISRGYEYK